MKPRNTEKGRRYINSLDAARCNGNWNEVPELVRKVSKHAPERKCLIEAARAECRITEHVEKATKSTESSTAPANDELLGLIPALLSAMEEEGSSPQEVFQAQVCLGWLHWSLSEPALASSRLPRDFEVSVHALSEDGQALSPWTEVCIIKGGYVKGAAQALTSDFDDALQTLSTVLDWLSTSVPSSSPQSSFWSEQFLSKSALLASDVVTKRENPSVRTITLALKAFRAWSSHGDVKRGDPASSGEKNVSLYTGPRSSTWKAYYTFLSAILQWQLPYIPLGEGPLRVQLSSEFRRVEAVCENILLRKVKFPRAHASNHQVETWVEEVIRNWEVLCSSDWSDDDFGEGGQDAVSRNVLDILYRAATKTFHSTLILRRLFHVHAALAEFDLAMKSFDTYLDIVTNAKIRAENSEKRLESLEDDDTFIRTVSESVIMLCCFGTRKEAEKANQLTDRLETLLDNLAEQHSDVSRSDRSFTPDTTSYITNDGKPVTVSVAAIAYQAVGIGLANWARWTPVNESRTSIQEAAATALEKSLAVGSEHGTNAATAFALGLLLAEMRDLNGAIDHVRSALKSANVADDASERSISHSDDHDIIPLWHLLTLLLSARQEFESAHEVCEAALDLGSSASSNQRALTSGGVPEGDEDRNRGTFTIGIYGTKSRQKESLVELRMTQLALVEILHGPEAAVNRCDEILNIFGQLFKGLGVTENEEKPKVERLVPPKSSAGTVRSFGGSFFRRSKSQQQQQQTGNENDTRSNGSIAPRLSTSSHGDSRAITGAPAIQVTNEETNDSADNPPLRPRSSRQKLHRRPGSLTKPSKGLSSETSSAAPSPSKSYHRREDVGFGFSAVGDRISPTIGHNASLDAKQSLPPVAHNMKYTKEPLPAGHASQPPQQDVRLPPSNRFNSPTKAVTRFPRVQAQKHALGLFVKIWLFIAGLYRRAMLFEDARDARNEAWEKASRLETLVAGQESSAKAFAEVGWGGAKSVDGIWADIHTEAGLLAQAQSQHHDAIEHFEEALMYDPDHSRATVGLGKLLLDIYDESLSAEEPQAEFDAGISNLSLTSTERSMKPAQPSKGTEESTSSQEDTPEKLNRLAARDRAYGLLSTLTMLGSAWDDSEAWFALSRAYEQGGQIEKAKEILWWCVELEDRRPIRPWWNIGSGAYVL